MPKESPELVAVINRWLRDAQRHDVEAMSAGLSKRHPTRFVGSDDAEWWKGQEVHDLLPELVGRVPEYELEVGDTEAYEEGEVGWGATRFRVHFIDRQSLTIRLTAVFVLEAGRWVIAQRHLSFPTPNVEAIGVELTPGLEQLLSAMEDEPAPAATEPIEGTTTVMFTDIVSSTVLLSELGDREWAEVLARQYRRAHSIIRDHGGTVVKTLGDGTMAHFPSAHGALRAAIGIQELARSPDADPQLPIRIGLHTGDVVKTEHDLLGRVVNKAARIAAAAEPGQIMVSTIVRDMAADGSFHFEDPTTVDLKGIPGTHEITALKY